MNDTTTKPETAANETKPAKGVLKKPAKATKPSTKKNAKAMPAPKPAVKKLDGISTLDELFDAFLAHLTKIGKSEGTARSYGADLAVARKHFGGDTKVTTLTARKVTTYFASDAVQKTRSGATKNLITTAKIQRVFRQAIEFATAGGLFEEAPLPTK